MKSPSWVGRRGWMSMCVVVGIFVPALPGCLFSGDTVEGTNGKTNSPSGVGSAIAPQCTFDADCAAFDTDEDACTHAVCESGRCAKRLIRNGVDCQCHADKDCTLDTQGCSVASCVAHRCVEKVLPEGPSLKDKPGDCQTSRCDGTPSAPKQAADLTDRPEDDNPCTTDTCEATGPRHTKLADGTACGSGICFDGACVVCQPVNPASCGAEGADEPRNDSSATPTAFTEYKPFCAYSNATDIDWYSFNATDGDFTHDVLNFHFWSTAPTIEVCAYVKCGNGGNPGGHCGLAGPNGSMGCCWSGPANTLSPSWDLDCSGTTEDEGAVWMSVRTPGADACEVYAMSGGY